VAIDEACGALGGWRLWECGLYVTLEPCPMCAGAILNARLREVVFGAHDPKNGACGSVVNLFTLPFTHKPALRSGVLRDECAALLTDFFRALRERGQP
jgi:tRNA(adenine34) deaminase